jgi:hypothetical protein
MAGLGAALARSFQAERPAGPGRRGSTQPLIARLRSWGASVAISGAVKGPEAE